MILLAHIQIANEDDDDDDDSDWQSSDTETSGDSDIGDEGDTTQWKAWMFIKK